MNKISKLIGNFIFLCVLVIFMVTGMIFSIDAEVARMDRADGKNPTDCIFQMNCRIRN